MNWRRVRAVLAVVSLLTPLTLLVGTRTAVAGPNDVGRWSGQGAWPFIPLHATLDDRGQVLTYGSTPSGEQGGLISYDVWDPSSGIFDGHTTLPNQQRVDTFCSITVTDPALDRLLVIGGNPDFNAGTANNRALQYNSGDKSLVPLGQDMSYGRWYPSATTLPDGRILIQGGSEHVDGGDWIAVTTPEIYETGKGFSLLPGARDDALYGDGTQYGRWWYPRTWVTPAGKLFGITGSAMYEVDPDGRGSIRRLGEFPTNNTRSSSTAVMYDVGKILQVGGGEGDSDSRFFEASNRATIIDVNFDPPRLTQTTPMRHARHWATATVLPDGRVLVTGGSRVNNELEGVALSPEIWDPATGQWTELAPNKTARLYHSVALLLPDGTVFTGGGGAPGPVVNKNAEVFSPPYLFTDSGADARRPVWKRTPTAINWGSTFQASVSNGAQIDRVTLIKTGAATHSTNGEQRFMELPFTQDGDTLWITGPANAALATPGKYLLYALDADGVPSVGSILTVGGSGGEIGISPAPAATSTPTTTPQSTDRGGDSIRPSIVPNVTSTASTSGVTVRWDQATDDGEIVEYLVSRSTNGTAGTRLATVASSRLGHFDTTAEPGVTYTYGVRAVDDAGNVSWHSRLTSVLARTSTPSSVPTTGPATSAERPSAVPPTTTPPSSDSSRFGVDVERPSIVRNLEVRSGPGMIGVRWDPSTDDRGVVAYLISRSTNGTAGAQIGRVSGAVLRFTDRDVVDGVTYTYGIRAIDAHGNLSWHAELASTRATAPQSVNELLAQLLRTARAPR